MPLDLGVDLGVQLSNLLSEKRQMVMERLLHCYWMGAGLEPIGLSLPHGLEILQMAHEGAQLLHFWCGWGPGRGYFLEAEAGDQLGIQRVGFVPCELTLGV